MSRSVVATIEVHCSQLHAFEVFTTQVDLWWPVGHRKFGKFGKSDQSVMRFAREVGGRFLERSSTGEEVELGKILGWEPPDRFAYSFYPGAIDKPTEVEVTFRSHGDHTVVTVTHAEAKSDLGDLWGDRAAGFLRAWDHVLPIFRDVAEKWNGKPWPVSTNV